MTLDTKTQGELIKVAAELAKSAGPTDEHRQMFGRTFLGTLLGQAVVLLGLMATYLVGLAIIWRYFFDDLKSLQTVVGVWAFWAIVTAPLACILLFSMLPTALRAMRERRMKLNVISGDVSPDAFRFYPYGESDRSDFKRLDGADKTILGWLSTSKSSVLYLSGASGVGKSSLLSASVLPTLRDKGWKIVETRLFGDPVGNLKSALFAAEPRLKKNANNEASLRDLVEAAVGHRRRRDAAPFALVIDQFEEFLILGKDEERTPFSAFLIELAKRPIEGLKLLLVFRSDYRALIFKLDLPPLVAGENWNELSAYDRTEAAAFLRARGRELVPEAADRLFRGLDRIEDAPGMYRLITLNMVGFVLERMGTKLEGDPGRLIQSYLASCLRDGEARDYAQHLLQFMITDDGTKEPRRETDLARLTHYESWKVKATLAELARQGLVRRVGDDIWEIAHDFLARTIGQLIGRLTLTPLQRIRPLVAPTVLLGWIAFATLAWPYVANMRQLSAQQGLRELGASLRASRSNGLSIVLDSTKLVSARPYLEMVNADALTIVRTSGGGFDLEPIRNLINLHELDVVRYPASANVGLSLEPLSGLTNLRELRVPNAMDLKYLSGLSSLTELYLDLSDETDLEPIGRLTSLDKLQLSGALQKVMSLDLFGHLPNLSSLELIGFESVASLDGLNYLTRLKRLRLDGLKNVTNLALLNKLTNVSELYLANMAKLVDVEPIANLTKLVNLELDSDLGVTSLEFITALYNLESLTLYSLPSVTNLELLGNLVKLKRITIRDVGTQLRLDPALLTMQRLESLTVGRSFRNDPVLSLLKERKVAVSVDAF